MVRFSGVLWKDVRSWSLVNLKWCVVIFLIFLFLIFSIWLLSSLWLRLIRLLKIRCRGFVIFLIWWLVSVWLVILCMFVFIMRVCLRLSWRILLFGWVFLRLMSFKRCWWSVKEMYRFILRFLRVLNLRVVWMRWFWWLWLCLMLILFWCLFNSVLIFWWLLLRKSVVGRSFLSSLMFLRMSCLVCWFLILMWFGVSLRVCLLRFVILVVLMSWLWLCRVVSVSCGDCWIRFL